MSLGLMKPVRKAGRRVRTPIQLQMHATDCGATCLGIVLAYFGRWLTLQQLREDCSVGRDGFSAADIVRAAARHKVEAEGWRKEIGQLRDMTFPLILHWRLDHFVVLEGIGRKWFYVNDPAFGRRKVGYEEFDQCFSGIVLEFKCGPDFEASGAPPSIVSRLIPWLRGEINTIAYVALAGVMLTLLLLATPFLLSVFVDHVFGQNEPWGGLVASMLAVAALFVYLLTWLKMRILRRLAIKLAISESIGAISHMLGLTIGFFNQRFAGDIVARLQAIDKISTGVSNHFLDLLIELAASIMFFCVMLAYDPVMAVIVLLLAVLNVVLMRIVTRLRLAENYKLHREQGLLQGVAFSGLQRMEFLRATGNDDSFYARWGGYQARELLARQRFAELGHVNAALPNLFLLLGNAVVLLFGAEQVMSGEMTLGTLMGFYVLAGMFLAPVGRFVTFADELQALEADLDRLDDVIKSPATTVSLIDEERTGKIRTVDGKLRLTGRVELRDVSFGYDVNRQPLITDFNLIMEPGQRIALVGYSGSGKSTVSQLVAGVLEQWTGQILFDDVPSGEVPAEVLSASLSVVEQQSMLFSATVRENLTLWNPTIPDESIVAAAQDACIHDEIISRNLGYDSVVNEGGSNFSGGQRQRLEIARALTNNPTILILDEATSALDARTEELIDNAIRRRGLSCLIVAHRLSTIRDCDRILVLEKGHVAQSGTHEDLLRDENGLYASLVKSS